MATFKITVTDRKEILKLARFLERRRLNPDEPLFVTYAEMYGEVVYDENATKKPKTRVVWLVVKTDEGLSWGGEWKSTRTAAKNLARLMNEDGLVTPVTVLRAVVDLPPAKRRAP